MLATVLVASALSVPLVSLLLQKYMHLALGPILIVVGMFLMGWIEIDSSGSRMGEGLQKWVDAMGVWGALPLGVVFALTFCPTSAFWFFGSLMPLSLQVHAHRRDLRACRHLLLIEVRLSGVLNRASFSHLLLKP